MNDFVLLLYGNTYVFNVKDKDIDYFRDVITNALADLLQKQRNCLIEIGSAKILASTIQGFYVRPKTTPTNEKFLEMLKETNSIIKKTVE